MNDVSHETAVTVSSEPAAPLDGESLQASFREVMAGVATPVTVKGTYSVATDCTLTITADLFTSPQETSTTAAAAKNRTRKAVLNVTR